MAEKVPAEVAIRRSDGTMEAWSVELSTLSPQRGYELTLRGPGGFESSAKAGDVFACLLELRRQLEPEGFHICVNGSRRDAWSSGMQRDMGEGLVVYLCEGALKGTRPPQVRTLDPTEPALVVPVDEQLAWHDEWLSSGAD